jgi:O-succinylbenzoate synthase
MPFDRGSDADSVLGTAGADPMAKAAIESAAWDLDARRQRIPLWQLLGGNAREIPAGVALGFEPTHEALFCRIERELAAGYQRIKIKIEPGRDIDLVAAVRARFPSIVLSADANGGYTSEHFGVLRQLDRFALSMIEQPLAADDLEGHARLQRELATPICLDESIASARDAERAIDAGACRIINLKMGRVGGIAESLKIERLCRERGIGLWCGGMLEAGIGRAHNIALSTLAGFTLPGDVSASARYWEEDIIEPPVTVTRRGTIVPPAGPGIGFHVKRDMIQRLSERTVTITGSVP